MSIFSGEFTESLYFWVIDLMAGCGFTMPISSSGVLGRYVAETVCLLTNAPLFLASYSRVNRPFASVIPQLGRPVSGWKLSSRLGAGSPLWVATPETGTIFGPLSQPAAASRARRSEMRRTRIGSTPQVGSADQ